MHLAICWTLNLATLKWLMWKKHQFCSSEVQYSLSQTWQSASLQFCVRLKPAPEQEPSQGCDSRRRRGVAREKLQEREFRASHEGKHKSRERRAEAARETGMNSGESEVNHGKTRGGQCQTGRRILCPCQYTALYIVLWAKTHTHTRLHTNHKEGRSWPLNKRTRL